jgi:hypothetical protein
MPLWGGAGVEMIAARSFHLNDETLVTKLLMIVDVPAMLAGALLLSRAAVAALSAEAQSYAAAIVWLGLGSVQWWIVGTVVARLRCLK